MKYILLYTASAAALFVGCMRLSAAHAADEIWIGPTPAQPHSDIRAGGVLQDSYAYHRTLATPAGAASPSVWYGYGFPVETYRWGWFGAARYYPTVTWHHGYYGHAARWAYRKGY